MLKYITNNISKLTKNEKKHILGILVNNTNKRHTKNRNGYLFDLSDVSTEIIDKIGNCVKLILDNRVLIDKKDTERRIELEDYKTLINNKLQESKDRELQEWYNLLQLRDRDSFNVSLQFKRKHVKEFVDPDVLIKDHLDSQKIKVGSRFYELNQIIKRLKRDIITHNYTQETNEDQDIDIDIDIDMEVYPDEEHNQEDILKDDHHNDDHNNDANNDPNSDDPNEKDDDHDHDNYHDNDNDNDPNDDDDESYDRDTNSDVSDNSCESEYRRLLSNFGLETVQKNEELKYIQYCVW